LDTYLRSHIEKLLIEVLAQYHGITLFITHKLEEAYRVCRNLIVLSQGTIQAAGKKEEIFQQPPTFEVAKVTECKNFSRARRLDPYHIEALDWDCLLRLDRAFPSPFGYVGLRAHHVQFAPDFEQNNTFPGWVTMTTETQHRISLYLKLHHAPRSRQDYHLQVEVYREKWEELQHRPSPWPIRLAPNRLMPLDH
jgi:molybdate transport system permease protein